MPHSSWQLLNRLLLSFPIAPRSFIHLFMIVLFSTRRDQGCIVSIMIIYIMQFVKLQWWSRKKKNTEVFLFLGLKTNPKSFIYIASSSSEISFYFILFPFFWIRPTWRIHNLITLLCCKTSFISLVHKNVSKLKRMRIEKYKTGAGAL